MIHPKYIADRMGNMDIGISEKAFFDIKKKFGDHASWAIWRKPQSGNWSSKEDVGDLK